MTNKAESVGAIRSTAELLSFPAEAVTDLCTNMERIARLPSALEKFTALIDSYGETGTLNFGAEVEALREISEESGVHEYACNMLHLLSLCPALRQRYARLGLSDGLFIDTVQDLRFKLTECRLCYGIWGTFVPEWFERFFGKLDRFFFSRLQFEPSELAADCTVDGIELKKGARVLNVHIPRTGTPLGHGAVLESYKRAADFYADLFPDGRVLFVCSSWLLFPKHKEVLRPDSNIMLFAADYTVISTKYYGDGSNLWRLFDKPYSGDPNDLPADSSLRRAYIDWIKKGERLGSSYGVIIYDKLKERLRQI